jgi:hypothetical protein
MTSSVPIPTPLPPAPRLVRRKPMSWGRFFVVAVFFLIVGFGLMTPLVIAVVPVWVHYTGRPVTAVVESRTYGTGKDASKRYIHYRYPWNGTTQSDREEISLDSYQRVRIGRKLSAQVAGWRGWSECLLTEPGYQSSVWGGAIAASIIAPIVGVFVFYIWLTFHRQKRLVRIGTAVPGTVTDKKTKTYRSTEYHVYYNYKCERGEAWNASIMVDSATYGRTEIGKTVTVLYDPDRHEQSTVYELVGFEAVGIVPIRLMGRKG